MFLLLPNPHAIAEYVSQRLVTLIKQKPKAVLGLATGSTMEPIYDCFSNQVAQEKINVSELTTFNLDEYLGLGPDHPQSYHFYMQQYLFNRVNFNPDNTFLPDGLCPNLVEQCTHYSALIQQKGGVDLQLLGIGSNGHIGFNEPGTPFSSRTHAVQLSEQTRIDNGRFFESMAEVPTQAITLGLQDIQESKQILLIATGSNKAQIMADLYHSAVCESLPASVVKQHPNAIIIVDEAAAALLPEKACKTPLQTV